MAVPITGQVTITGTAQTLSASTVLVAAFTIKAPLSNLNPVYIGPAGVTTGNGHQMDPGDNLEYEYTVQNGQPVYQLRPSDFSVVGTPSVGDKVTWLATPAV